jgi:hypothetical protein
MKNSIVKSHGRDASPFAAYVIVLHYMEILEEGE